MTTFAVKFLGCKVSQADAMLARRRLLEAGHEEVAEADAELHVINTCCITREAESKSRQSVRRSLKGAEQGRRVIVSGCATNLNPTQFSEIAPQVTALVGTADDVAVEAAGEAGPACIDTELRTPAADLSRSRTRGFVKIQDGCNCHCSYCIIPEGARLGPLARLGGRARRGAKARRRRDSRRW